MEPEYWLANSEGTPRSKVRIAEGSNRVGERRQPSRGLALSPTLVKDKMLSSFEESLSLIKKSEVRISEQRIGQGSFGDIYQGIYKGGRVAVKVLRAKKRTNRNLRLLQEEGIHLMKLKQHPNVNFKRIHTFHEY